jgi:hypothetical protein
MKLVLNKAYGGFGLSDGATRHLAALKGIQLFEKDCEFWTEFYLDPAHSLPFTAHDLDRTDPDLIRVVEEFGALANGSASRLEIVDLHSGQQYRICEYDGKEWLELPSDIKWETAA